ncbi:hypothetical protein AGMMS49545_17160 [Betaproteobacteria bacterium]|nr:hypothetical protein AGMMS49545_17160 [Betaproteobacteria bacterium]GHU43167.1 hypothetical protein AGMMS50289_09130 [Betaproteobacteria bacterium]
MAFQFKHCGQMVFAPGIDEAALMDAAGLNPEFGEVTMKPEAETELTGDDAVKMQKLLEK